MAQFYIQTYGCQMNVQESDVVRRVLTDAGYAETADESDADVMLLMTCSVRSHAEARAVGRLGGMRALRDVRPGAVVGVLGCMAQRLGRNLVTEHHVDLVVGPDNYLRLPELIEQARSNGGAVATEETGECYEHVSPLPGRAVTSFVTVMRGCDNYCTYCIVPHVKGRERSRPLGSVLSEARELAGRGVRDITLLGQNVLAWREGEQRFPALLEAVALSVPGVRVRFLTSHPRDVDATLFETMARLPNVCPALHLPLQSGSNRLLGLMNRGYTLEDYLSRVELARRTLPSLGLTTDLIVGFPSETEDDFLSTLRVVRDVRFDYAYMFRFSARAGTPAATMTPRVSEADGGRRLARLIEVQNRITRELNGAMVGSEFELLVEGPSPRGADAIGRTATNKIVILRGGAQPGELVRCRVTAVQGWTPVAEVVPPVKAN